MKVLSTMLSLTMLFSVNAMASNNTYVYSNFEYCQLQTQGAAASQLDAYARKLGFMPNQHDCRALLQPSNTRNDQQAVSAQLRNLQRGSVIRITKKTEQKLAALSADERAEVLKRFGLR
ncbi:hypothetical protein GCM10010919_20600 [Alishewanella longhuensis]|uniref:DUF3718 domain-containing protein n=2 Tax=Alishewanella longhuensis TaxID=1091037 RepID=A0ABQ3KZZ5_9ALTE|nr:hypothetical protein GCM10010919_20600 [Alishewanella longhuensis]